jgi:tetratricopeptide (TPR) repeat protein
LAIVLEQVNDADRQGNFASAQQHLEEIVAYCRQHLGQDHYLVHQYESAVAWYKWYSALSESQRASVREVGAIITDGEHSFAKADYDAAANKYLQVTEVLDRLKMPAFGDYAKDQLRLAQALCRSGKRGESISPAYKGYILAVSSDGEISSLAADALYTVGEVHDSLGEYPRSVRELCRACKIWAACNPQFAKEETTAETYMNALLLIADSLIAVGDYDRASGCIDTVAKLVAERTPSDNTWVCRVKCYEYALLDYEGHYQQALWKAQDWLDFAQKSFTSDNDEVLTPKTAKAEALFKLGKNSEANDLVGEILEVKLKDNPSHGLKGGWFTDTCARADIAKDQYAGAIAMLEPRIQLEEKDIGPESSGLHDLLKPYAEALHHLGRDEEAKKVEAQLHKIDASLAAMRRQIDTDPECKFPWEK